MIQKIVFKNREEWLKHKNESFKLSSSNIGIILGYSEYITPFQYWDKIKKGEITENTNTIRGNLFENSISEYFENVSTERVVKNTQKYFVLRRDDLPEYIEVSPDRELFKKERKKRVILEVKDTKRYIDIYNDDEAIIQEEIDDFYVWYQGRALIPRIQEIKEDAVTDLNLRLHKILGKLPLSEQERKDLEASIDTAAGKVVTKMIFGLRDTLETDAFIDCVEGLEKVYEE